MRPNLLARQHAERFDQLESNAAPGPGEGHRRQPDERCEQALDAIVEPGREARFDPLSFRSIEMVIGHQIEAWAQHVVAGGEARDGGAVPPDAAVRPKLEGVVRGLRQSAGAAGDRPAEDAVDRRPNRPAFGDAVRLGDEAEAPKAADIVAFDVQLAGPVDRRQQLVAVLQPAHQQRRSAVDEALG